MADALSEENIRAFTAAWYNALDIHAPLEDVLKMLADNGTGLEIVFPEKTAHTTEEFKVWYDAVTHFFFDENHNVVSVEIRESTADTATLGVVVAWQASWFNPPAAKSKRTSMNATQKWVVRKSNKNAFGLEILFYNATEKPFEYAPGFARL